ncbi:AraC family transcriptional regulator [Microlunatus endophyticus]|nr:helix-turn-helix domain-containing protein [Microlunatus endophyticus]
MLSRSESFQHRDELLARLAPPIQFNELFDYLRGVHFFAKNTAGEILFASVGLARLYGFDSETEFIGCTDFDVLPVGLARKFRRDDVEVMTTGRRLLGIVELFPNPQGIPDWYLTNKLPLRDADGTVLGLMGSIQTHRDATEQAHPPFGIDIAVSRMRENPSENLSIRELAALCSMSVRQFEIRFKEVYRLSPHQFRIRLRVMNACENLRNTDLPIADVATVAGFYDQSALARHFEAVMGYSPRQYRRRFTLG